MDNVGYIYVLTSPSGKHYVGQSWCIDNRYYAYMTMNISKYQNKLYNALKKYGSKNFEFYIISSATTQKELDERERYWMDMYDSRNNKFGYNIKEGGVGGRHSEETKKKIGISNKGHKTSQETRDKIGKTNMGHKLSQESRDKISNANMSNKSALGYGYKKLNYIYTIKNNITNEVTLVIDLKLFCKENNLIYTSIYWCIKHQLVYKNYLTVTRELIIKK